MASKYANFWTMTEENRRSFRYEPYGSFGACYRPPDLAALARLKKRYESQIAIIGYSALSLYVFVPHNGPIFLTEGKFLLWGVVVLIGYGVSSNGITKSLELVAPRQPFWQAFQACALKANSRSVAIAQIILLLLIIVATFGLRRYPTHELDCVVRYVELVLVILLELVSAAMFAARGTRATVRR